MKKIFTLLCIGFMMIALSACKDDAPIGDLKLHTLNYLNEYMDTYISVNIWLEDGVSIDIYKQEIESIFGLYHDISTGYEALPESSNFKTNIYEINNNIGEIIEIDYELYEILRYAEELKEITDGYFDISIGKIVDVWKDVILNEFDGFLFSEIPNEVFTNILEKLETIDVVSDPYELTEEDNKYFVKINSEHVKLDLGALSKGFATQKVDDYLQDMGITFYSVSSGSSSINLGENYARDTRMFHVSLANPLRTGMTDRTYGMIKASNTGITTSGNYEQYALYQGLRYHHIISPKTKMPMHYYHTVTMVGDHSGFLDAISTALFSMNEADFNTWMETYQDVYRIEIVRTNYDGSVTTFLEDYIFEAH